MDTQKTYKPRKTGSFRDYVKGPCSLNEYCKSDEYLYSVEPLSIFRLNLLFEDLELDSSFDLHDAFDSVLTCDKKYELLQKSVDNTYAQIDALYKVLRTLQDKQRAVALKKALIQERIKVHFDTSDPSRQGTESSSDRPVILNDLIDECDPTVYEYVPVSDSKDNDSSDS